MPKPMSAISADLDDISSVLVRARPQAMAALLRYFRDLETASEAYQEACVRALRDWPAKLVPRDPLAWLIVVARNAALDAQQERKRFDPLPPEELLSDTGDAEALLIDRLDSAPYRDDVLRLLFICCHPDLNPRDQIALALRVVCGLSVREIASAFLVGEAAMEQRITRAKQRIGGSAIAFETPGPAERAARMASVNAMILLLFNEGYAASGGAQHVRAPLCEEAIRLARLLLHLFPDVPETMGLTALLLLQHARVRARLDDAGELVLLESQDRNLWDRALIGEGLALVDSALRRAPLGPYQVQAAIAAMHAHAARPEDTDWAEIDLLYAALEALQPSPIVTLNRAVAVDKVRGAAAALSMIDPLADALAAYFPYFGLRGALLKRLNDHDAARDAFTRALALARTAQERSHILLQLDGLAMKA